MGRGDPLPNRLGVWGSVVSSPSGVRGAEPRLKTNLVTFVVARRTLIATICLISVSLNTAVVFTLTIVLNVAKVLYNNVITANRLSIYGMLVT